MVSRQLQQQPIKAGVARSIEGKGADSSAVKNFKSVSRHAETLPMQVRENGGNRQGQGGVKSHPQAAEERGRRGEKAKSAPPSKTLNPKPSKADLSREYASLSATSRGHAVRTICGSCFSRFPPPPLLQARSQICSLSLAWKACRELSQS